MSVNDVVELAPEWLPPLINVLSCESVLVSPRFLKRLDQFENGEWQPLQEVIGSALHHLDCRLDTRRVHIDLAADLPLVQLDALAIEQVLINIIDNAVEYTPDGSAITISARLQDEEVVVEVADEGSGLPAGTEQRIFEKFFRAGRNRRGIGLGLAIARGIVEAHGGKITARNRADRGALFRFTIPLVGAAPLVDTRG